MNIFDILSSIGQTYKVAGCDHSGEFAGLAAIIDATERDLVFVDSEHSNKRNLILETRANLVLCDQVLCEDDFALRSKTLIITEQPKLVFARVSLSVYQQSFLPRIHSSAVIAKSAKIDPSAHIGPFVTIGEDCVIGEGSIIHSAVTLCAGTLIGKKVEISSGAQVGVAGFGYVADENGRNVSFPQIGWVEIHDYVTLGSSVTICRGALGATVIGENTKIDSLTYVAHNAKIGSNCLVAAKAVINGSCCIGNDVWIGPGVNVSDHLEVQDGASLTIGSTVTRTVLSGERVTGYLAQPHVHFMKKYLDIFR